MAKSVTVTLAGVDYSVPHLNIGQLEEVTEAFSQAGAASFRVLRIALRRAEPKIESVDAIEAEPDEVSAAVSAILIASGLKKAEAPKDASAPNGSGPG